MSSLDAELAANNGRDRAIAHPYEREAVGLLYRANWSVEELAMTFMCSAGAIRRVLREQGVAGDE